MFRKTASALALSASFLVAGFTGTASAQYATQVNYTGGAPMGRKKAGSSFQVTNPAAPPGSQLAQIMVR